ncbi:MAG: methyltransferase domain-containing protein [Opitutales bacterium]|nr:methyltransferase domain-containing protein [Opitutales bacterium]
MKDQNNPLPELTVDAHRFRNEPFETIKSRFSGMESEDHCESALQDLKNWISWNPLVPEAFVLLAELYEKMGRVGESVVCFQRALQLKEVSAQREPSEAALRLIDFEKQALNELSTVSVKGMVFPRLRLVDSGAGMTLVGRSFDQRYFIKIEVCPSPLKNNTLAQEASILEKLCRGGGVSAPGFHGSGVVPSEGLQQVVNSADWEKIKGLLQEELPYYIQDYLPADKGYTYADIALALLEQKQLGVYHGDISPDNIRFSKEEGIVHLIDYDQAVELPSEVIALTNRDFFQWCTEYARKKYARWNHPHFMAYFSGFDFNRDFWPLFRGDALNLAHTSVFTDQITTAAKQKIYHTIETDKVFIRGERSLGERKGFLDAIPFAEGESVLDVGCSSGILSMYLAHRGCRVKGVEIDAKLIRGNQMLANILALPIEYEALDLDLAETLDPVDTVCLFSVIHHTKKLEENGRKIARACRKRILIECRLREYGLKWTGKSFEKSSAWNYPDLDAMTRGLEKLFPGLRYHANHGQGDRDRYLLEFVVA